MMSLKSTNFGHISEKSEGMAIFFYINEGRMPQHTLWMTTK
jgi:hypothetical protein